MSRINLIKLILPNIEIFETGNGFENLEPSKEWVTVIIPSYDDEEYVEEAVQSALQQTYPKIEIILIDDGSQDQTFEIALAILKKSSRPYCAIKKPNEGLVPSLNAGIQMSYGGWIAILASDDIFYPHKISMQVEVGMKENADVVIALDDEITEEGNLFSKGSMNLNEFKQKSSEQLRQSVLEGYNFKYMRLLTSRAAFYKIGLYNTNVFAEEFDFSVKLCSNMLRRVYLDKSVGAHRMSHGDKYPLDWINRVLASYKQIVKQYCRNFNEHRWCLSKILTNFSINKLRNGYLLSATFDFLKGFVFSPWCASKVLCQRFRGYLSKKVVSVKALNTDIKIVSDA